MFEKAKTHKSREEEADMMWRRRREKEVSTPWGNEQTQELEEQNKKDMTEFSDGFLLSIIHASFLLCLFETKILLFNQSLVLG